VSSMVLPFEAEDRIAGVMNLGASKGLPVRFNADNAKLINKLINLTTTALE